MIRTRRLDLVPLGRDFLRAALGGRHDEASRLLGATMPSEWPGEAEATLMFRLVQLETDPGILPWLLHAIVLRDECRMVGHIGFHTGPGEPYLDAIAQGGVELGYGVCALDRRNGYAFEAAEGLMQWAATSHGVRLFVVSIAKGNGPSIELATKLGFRKAGEHIDPDEGPEDLFVREHHEGRMPQPA